VTTKRERREYLFSNWYIYNLLASCDVKLPTVMAALGKEHQVNSFNVDPVSLQFSSNHIFTVYKEGTDAAQCIYNLQRMIYKTLLSTAIEDIL
jgi:hypothetical protein